MTDKPHVWVVTTTFNRPAKLKTYIDCLSQQTWPSFTLILIDHGTESISADITFPFDTVVLRANPLLWWTTAVNTGIRSVLGEAGVRDRDLVLLQNDDSSFGSEFISVLVAATDKSRRVVGSVAIDRNTGRVLHANLKFHPLRVRYEYLHYGMMPATLGTELLPTDVLKGRGVAYPVGVVRRIGVLDERLPQYRSDHEWAHRAKTSGVEILVAPAAVCETEIDTQERISSRDPIRSFWRVLFGRKSPANLPDMAKYYFICFGPALAADFVSVDCVRTVIVSMLKVCRALLWRPKSKVDADG